MSDSTEHPHHGVDYVELAAVDMAATRAFFESAFDWQFNEYGPDYLGIRKPDGGEYGGIRKDDAVGTGGPLIVLYSRDLEATLAKVQEAGGRITKEIFSFPGGRRFQFLDPSGNELAVWSDQG